MRRDSEPDSRTSWKDKKMDKALIANIIIIILELISFYMCRSHWLELLVFYTQLSNFVTLISSVCFVISRDAEVTITLRYLSTVMLVMTVLVTLAVLVPAGAGFVRMMLSGNGLFHHTLCPLISITSYFLWEQHSSAWMIPVAVTFVYGAVLLYLNYARIIEGPYPFFRVYKQSIKATVIWMTVLIVLAAILSLGVMHIAN